MSDYIPQPETEMHINQMPEECLRALFTQLPFESQFEVGDVCRQWRTVRDALFLAKKSLVIVIDNCAYSDIISDLIITGLNEARTAFLVAMFPSLNELTIFTNNENLFKEPAPVAHLLTQYRDRLITLKLHSGGALPSGIHISTSIDLFDSINAMSKLKRLTLHFDSSSGQLPPFNLPILRQLDKLDFDCYKMSSFIITLWAPHLEARSTPMEISFPACWANNAHSTTNLALFESLTPKVASMFTHFPRFYCSLQQFQRLATRFTNLIELELDDDFEGDHLPYWSSVPALMHSLVNLKHLTTLSITTRYAPQVDGQPAGVDHLPPQLPTLKKLNLSLRAERTYSHSHLSPWTTNLGWHFPNLQDLSILLYGCQCCADCDYDALISYIGDDETFDEKFLATNARAKDCLRHQLRLIKQQQCPQLKTASMQCIMLVSCTLTMLVDCTLEDIAD